MKIVDLKVIENNIKKINNDFYAVVKNECYGLGYEIIDLLIKLNVKKFCVNTLQEGIILRNKSKEIYILLLSDFNIDEIYLYKKYNITVTLSFIDKLKYLDDINYEIKLNMGLNRYGLDVKDYFKTNKIYYTHLPNDVEISNLNIYNFKHFNASQRLDKNSNLRLGMALYKDCLEIIDEIKNIWFVKKGEHVGYDYIVDDDSYFGIINIGYYKGLTSKNVGRLVYINNKYYKIVSISMNHTFIKIDKYVKIKDKVELMGKNVSLKYLSKYLNLNEYEVFTMIKDDIKYIKED